MKIAGKILGKLSEYPVNVGVIIEYPGFIDDYSGFENLKYLASIRNLIDEKRILEILELLGLSDAKDLKVKKYSLGMRQRLGVAQAIMEYPDLLILDEPFNSLDDEAVELIKRILVDLKLAGCTILIATHSKELVGDIFDKTIKMSGGRIVKSND